MAEDIVSLISEARGLIGYSNVDFAEFLGVSARTVSRHAESAGVPMGAGHYEKIVQAVHPKNPVLAGKIAAHIGKSLADCGVTGRLSGPAPQATRMHAEALVCAAADAMEMVPKKARPIVAAIFRQAKDLGVDLPSLVELLAQQS